MEKYSFIKFVNMKEKIYRDKIAELQKQIGGNTTVDLSSIQKEILKIQLKLEDIKSRKVDTLIDPYADLKDMIDKINASVNEIDKNIEILGEDATEMKKKEIMNKIADINVVLDADPKDYNKLIAQTKINFVGERLNPELITAPITAHIKATEDLIKLAKSKLGGGLNIAGGDTLVENEDFNQIFQDISGKIAEFEEKKVPFNELKDELNAYINQMEGLFASDNIIIEDGTTPQEPGNLALLIDVAESDADDGKGELDLTSGELAIIEEKEVSQLISPDFLTKKGTPGVGVLAGLPGAPKQLTPTTKAGDVDPSVRQGSTDEQDNGDGRLEGDGRPEGEDRKYLKFNEKYYQEPDTKKITVTDEKVNQSMNSLHNEWVTKMKGYQAYLITKKEKLDEIAKNTKILKEIKALADKYEGVYDTIKMDKSKITLLIGQLTVKLNQYIGLVAQLDTSTDIAIPTTDPNFGKTELREIRGALETKRDSLGNEVRKATQCDSTIRSHMIDMRLSRYLNGRESPKLLTAYLKPELAAGPPFPATSIFYQAQTFPGNKAKIAEIKSCLSTVENIEYNKIIFDYLNSVLPTIEVTNKYLHLQLGGAKQHIHQVIEQLRLYEIEVRNMKEVRKELELLIKKYNIRYVQFYNFQKYIVNYVSIKIASGGYSYYQFVSKGLISYYGELLKTLKQIFDKFDEYKKYSLDTDLAKSENKWFYGKHYFMIKILYTFLDKFYKLWDENEKSSSEADRLAWNRDTKQIKTDTNNKMYWFLFNIFINIMDAYSMTLPSIANYIRINEIKNIKGATAGEPNTSNIARFTFNKGSKYSLELSGKTTNNAGEEVTSGLQVCDTLDPKEGVKADEIANVKFQEVFDKDFTNDSLSSYMGLSNFLKKGKSIMILTYGYSGVGKSFTLFGKKGSKGMLQSTLAYLGDSVNIAVKPFELYGLGVPYKFYWKDSSKFTHFIYAYTITPGEATLQGSASKKNRNQFKTFLDRSDDTNYSKLTLKQINEFSNIVELIDDERRATGRIKATVNNPESSRSIMIYDFKITKKDAKEGDAPVHFVVMDLPGKENLFETYCAKEYSNFELDPKFTTFAEPTPEQASMNGGKYDSTYLKAMFYINPLWLSLIPETAKHFDKQNTNNHFNLTKPNGGGDGAGINIPVYGEYNLSGSAVANFHDSIYSPKNINSQKNPSSKNYDRRSRFAKVDTSTAHGQYRRFGGEAWNPRSIDSGGFIMQGKTQIPLTKEAIQNKIGLSALSERAMFTIVQLIKEGKLEELGSMLNDMLADPTAKSKNYGYAGLEGIYINENILGLLQVLSNRIRTIKKNIPKGESLRPEDKINVVCQQKEVYRDLIYNKSERLPIEVKLLESQDGGYVTFNAGQTALTSSLKDEQAFFVDEDEFFSQVLWMNEIGDTLYKDVTVYEQRHQNTPSKITKRGDEKFFLDTMLRDPVEMRKYADQINNYNYNKIFNIEEPPIQKVLEEYLDEIDNYYLFFVVSNNLKTAPGQAPTAGDGIETCDKQMKLIHDTRFFMNVISAKDDEELNRMRLVCDN